MGNLFTEAMGNILTTLMGNVLTELVGKVLDIYRAITIPDEYPFEERFVTVGMDALGRILVVVYTWRRDRIRIISARKATTKEINQYKG
jgi:uncharacterized DUF497 family protein